MAYTTINKSTDYFNTLLYTGNGSARTITGVGFQPDWVWVKERNSTNFHYVYDVVRGNNLNVYTNATDADTNVTSALGGGGIGSQASDGFNIVSGTSNTNNVNTSSNTYVSWNWKAGTTSGLSGGTITPSSYSINTTSGFGIYTYTGTGSAGTIAHGLGSTPKMIIVKCRSDADTWAVYHEDVGATKYLELDTTAAAQTSTQPWNDTAPTSSVFTVGNWSATNGSSRTYVAYCFVEKAGYSKFGSYTGNGSTNGPFIYTGFKPSWLMVKRYDGGANNWLILDNKRDSTNQMGKGLLPDSTAAEATGYNCDFLSNGFKFRLSGSGENGSSNTYIYMAFGQSLVGTNNIPCTAR